MQTDSKYKVDLMESRIKTCNDLIGKNALIIDTQSDPRRLAMHWRSLTVLLITDLTLSNCLLCQRQCVSFDVRFEGSPIYEKAWLQEVQPLFELDRLLGSMFQQFRDGFVQGAALDPFRSTLLVRNNIPDGPNSALARHLQQCKRNGRLSIAIKCHCLYASEFKRRFAIIHIAAQKHDILIEKVRECASFLPCCKGVYALDPNQSEISVFRGETKHGFDANETVASVYSRGKAFGELLVEFLPLTNQE